MPVNDNQIVLDLPEGERNFDPSSQLTVSVLRHIKGWYPDLARALTLIQRVSLGDPRAARCAIWIVRRAEGTPGLVEPSRLPDFPVGKVTMAKNRRKGALFITEFIFDLPAGFPLEGEVKFDLDTHLTASLLEKMGKRYPELGSVSELYAGLCMGDPDAAACCIHAALVAAGVDKPPFPWELPDFAVSAAVIEPNEASFTAAAQRRPDEDEEADPWAVPMQAPEAPERPLAHPTTSPPSGTQKATRTTSGPRGTSPSSPSATSAPTS